MAQEMESFEALLAEFEQAQTSVVREGEIVSGKVVDFVGDFVVVDIGYKSEGQVPKDEFKGPDGELTVKVGDTVDVYVEATENETTPSKIAPSWRRSSVCSLSTARSFSKSARRDKTMLPRFLLNLMILKRYFWLMNLSRLRVGRSSTWLPWGRVTHPNEVVQIGDEIKVKVLKFTPENERVSLGYKQLAPDPWVHAAERYPTGVRALGRVVSLIDYGAFVELEEGIEGLIHISEMSWTRRVKHPSRVVNVNDVIDVVVLSLDTEAKKISLGMKQTEPNPWEILEEKYPVGTIIKGKIRNITDFGLFIGVEDGIDGLVHVSDISWTQKVRNPNEIYKKGDEVEAVVLNIDVANERFSLGIKQLTSDPWDKLQERYPLGSVVDCKITKITEFGAFASIEEGVEGLIHISELSRDHVEDPSLVVKIGETHKAEVISVDSAERKIALSIKQFVRNSENGRLRQYSDNDASSTAHLGDLLQDKLSDFENK